MKVSSTVWGRTNVLLALAALVAISFLFARVGQAEPPPTWLNYQGRLSAASGAAVADGQYSVVFRLFAAPTGGTSLWSETRTVTAKGGVFATTLGQAAPFPEGLFTQRLWLEIEVQGHVLTPRQELGAVAFSHFAMKMPSGAVTTVMLADLSVTTAKLAAGAVNSEKLASDPVSLSRVSAGAMATNGGNVGIGVEQPLARLHVGPGAVRLERGGRIDFGEIGTGTQLADDTAESRTLMRTRGGRLDLVNEANNDWTAIFTRDTSYLNSARLTFEHPSVVLQSSGRMHIQAGERLYLNPWGNGDVHVGGGGGHGTFVASGNAYANAFITTSSARYKENVSPLSASLAKVMRLQGVAYDRKNAKESHREIGFIAEEVAKVVPEVVGRRDGRIEGLDYSKLTALLVEALKEQQREIDHLKSELAALTAKSNGEFATEEGRKR